jgi:hypothetical protein
MESVSEAREKRRVLEQIAIDLVRLQTLAKGIDENFVAFLITSALREAGSRRRELSAGRRPEPATYPPQPETV